MSVRDLPIPQVSEWAKNEANAERAVNNQKEGNKDVDSEDAFELAIVSLALSSRAGVEQESLKMACFIVGGGNLACYLP